MLGHHGGGGGLEFGHLKLGRLKFGRPMGGRGARTPFGPGGKMLEIAADEIEPFAAIDLIGAAPAAAPAASAPA